MSYKELYNHCQTLSPLPKGYIGKNIVRDKILEITGTPKIDVRRADMDPAICRGFYLAGSNKNHPIVKQHGCDVIVVARELPREWERLIIVKEMMHLFDSAKEATDTDQKFEDLLADFSGAGPIRSDQMEAETKAFWMALGVLCPEGRRMELRKDVKDGKKTFYDVALELHLPEMHMGRLLDSLYEKIIKVLIE